MHAHDPRIDWRRSGAEVAHELRGGLGDVCGLAEFLRVGDAMVGVVRSGEAREFLRMGHPVEIAGIDDRAAHAGSVAVHVLGGGVRDDVHAVLERTAVDRRREGVVDDQWHAVTMRCVRELLEVEHDKRRVGDGLAEHGLGVRLERGLKFLFGAVGADEGAFDAHLAHGHVDEVEGAAVDGGGGDDVVAVVADVEQREEVRRLAGRGEHRGRAAFQLADLRGDGVVGRILQAGVEVAGFGQVEQSAHLFARLVFEGRGLDDWGSAGFSIARLIASLHADGVDVFAHMFLLSIPRFRAPRRCCAAMRTNKHTVSLH